MVEFVPLCEVRHAIEQKLWLGSIFFHGRLGSYLTVHEVTGSALGFPEGDYNPANVVLDIRPVPATQNDNGNMPVPEIYLVLETLVGSQQNVKPFCFGGVQQFPVCKAMPSAFSCRFDCVAAQRVPKWSRGVVVKQNPHAQVLEHSRRRNR